MKNIIYASQEILQINKPHTEIGQYIYHIIYYTTHKPLTVVYFFYTNIIANITKYGIFYQRSKSSTKHKVFTL